MSYNNTYHQPGNLNIHGCIANLCNSLVVTSFYIYLLLQAEVYGVLGSNGNVYEYALISKPVLGICIPSP